mgnify:CR=1 FL=1
MEEPISITWLNDFIFCPASIYFHNLYGTVSSVSFQDVSQINGSSAHRRLDSGKYSTRKTLLSGISVYSEKYNLIIFPFNFYCCRFMQSFRRALPLIFPFNFYCCRFAQPFKVELRTLIFPFNFYCCRLTGLFTLLLSLIFPFNFYCCRSRWGYFLHPSLIFPFNFYFL